MPPCTSDPITGHADPQSDAIAHGLTAKSPIKYMPHLNHQQQSILYSTPLTSPSTIPERRPFFTETSLSPPPTPGVFTSHYSQDTLRKEYSRQEDTSGRTTAGTGSKRVSRDSDIESPIIAGYQTQESERYRLVGNRPVSFLRMDMEVQRMKEKDTKLKRNIRRFRFVVRSAHLACRYIPPDLCLLILVQF